MLSWFRRKAPTAERPAAPAGDASAAALELAQRGDMPGALEAFRTATTIDPADALAWMGLGNVLLALGRPAEALEPLGRAQALAPGLLAARLNAVQCLRSLGRVEEALAASQAAVAAAPSDPLAAKALARGLADAGRPHEAASALESALELAPEDASLWSEYAELLRGSQQADAAEQAFRRALAIDPDHPAALGNLGRLLCDLRRHDVAEPLLRRALDFPASRASAQVNLAGICLAQNRLDEAEALLMAAAQSPGVQALAWANLANLRFAQERLPEALQASSQAIDAGLSTPETRTYRAHILLASGDLPAGFREFEHRLGLAELAGGLAGRPGTLWRGEPLAGRRILLWAEQGLGDTLQFARYVLPLAQAGAHVILAVQAPLRNLLRDSLPVEVVGLEEPVAADFHCPLLSLAERLGTDAGTIPWPGPYLRPPVGTAALADLDALPRPRVGLVWAGNPAHHNDANRSMPFDALLPLLATPGVGFCSLQMGAAASAAADRPAQAHWVDVAPSLRDFADTAAALARLDLVLAVDTSVAHLAGGLGIPGAILLAFAPDWRWHLERDRSPWYPSLRLLRQRAPRDWRSVVEDATALVVEARDAPTRHPAAPGTRPGTLPPFP